MSDSIDIFTLPSSQNHFEEPLPFGQMNPTLIHIITNKINIQMKVQREYKGEGIFRKYLALYF